MGYLVSVCDFIDPVNRNPLTREECVRLDTHIRDHHPEQPFVSVTDAFDLFKLNGGGGESNGTMQRADASGHAINFTEGGLAVVDDDDILTPLDLTSTTPHPAGVARSWEHEVRDDFPLLPGSRPKSSEPSRVQPHYGPKNRVGNASSSSGYPPLPSPLPRPEQHIKPSNPKVPAQKKRGKEKVAERFSVDDRGRPCGKIKQTLYSGPKAWAVPKPTMAKSVGVAKKSAARG